MSRPGELPLSDNVQQAIGVQIGEDLGRSTAFVLEVNVVAGNGPHGLEALHQ